MAIIKLLRLDRILRPGEVLTWSFALGFGVLGWLAFFVGWAGYFSWLPLVLLIASGLPFVIFLHRELLLLCRLARGWRPGGTGLILLIGFLFIIAFDVLEALPPPSDADTLAYHFALPKIFIEKGRIEFVPRAVDGAVPMLVNMTYVPVLALGGEKALTFWTMVSTWFAGALLFSLSLRHLSTHWALAAVLIFLSTPAVIYGGGSGQVEVRLAIFAMLCAFAVGLAIKTQDWRFAIVAGLTAGFFIGGKYTGLLFVAGSGCVMLCQKSWFKHGAIMAVAALVAGSQWYCWNWAHTGDPFFPVLFEVLKDVVNYQHWDQSHANFLKERYFILETPLGNSLLGLISYPFLATISPFSQFDSGRTGLGPFLFLLLPFVLISVFVYRSRILRHPLFPIVMIALLYYVLWFLSGSSQKIRHILPIYPVALICFLVAAQRLAGLWQLRAIESIAGLTIVIHLAALFMFSINAARFVLTNETANQYLSRTVIGYDTVRWANSNLGAKDRLYTPFRQTLYYLDVPYFFAISTTQKQIEMREQYTDTQKFAQQAKEQGISHILVPTPLAKLQPGYFGKLLEKGCILPTKIIPIVRFPSRTLRSFFNEHNVEATVYKFIPKPCL